MSASSYLESADVRSRPYRYFTAGAVVSAPLADRLLAWLETEAAWRLHEGAFFEQYECNLLGEPARGRFPELFGAAALATLRRRLQVLLGCELTERMEVVGHKLLPAQGIGIHTDEPHEDRETHRFILQLNRGWPHGNGGHLFLFNSAHPLDIHAVVPPVHNSGLGFAMSARSYHAVSDVRRGIRYTAVYSFWKKPGSRATRVPGRPELHRRVPHTAFLRSVAAHATGHSGASLLRHLSNTYRILMRWGCPQRVCLAGLFHSLYGTESFRHASCAPEQRCFVREMIGADAEQLVWLYCVTSRESLYANLERESGYSLRDFRDGAVLPISAGCLADLMTMDLANSLEQLARVALTPRIIADERSRYEKAVGLLPVAATIEMHWAYSSRNLAADEVPLALRLSRLEEAARARIERVLLEALAKERAHGEV